MWGRAPIPFAVDTSLVVVTLSVITRDRRPISTPVSERPDASHLVDIEDPDELRAYLVRTGRTNAEEIREIAVLGGGVSNRTVRVVRAIGSGWILKQALENLRVPADWSSPRERIFREAAGLRWLAATLPEGAVPEFLFEDREQYLFAMSEVPAPRRNWKEMLLAGELRVEHVEEAASLLAAVHRAGSSWRRGVVPGTGSDRASSDPQSSSPQNEAVGSPPGVPELFRDRTSVETLRLRPYYEYAAGRVEEAAPFLRALVEETRDRSDTVVHGDFSPKNLLVRPDRMVLLDHEVIHVGDAALDLGFFLTHLLSKAHHVRALRAEFVGAVRRFWPVYRAELDLPGAGSAASSVSSRPVKAGPGSARSVGRSGGEGSEPAPAWATDLEERAVRHLAGCLLARAAGKSRLEYLSEEARERQISAVLAVLDGESTGIDGFADAFHRALEDRDPTE